MRQEEQLLALLLKVGLIAAFLGGCFVAAELARLLA